MAKDDDKAAGSLELIEFREQQAQRLMNPATALDEPWHLIDHLIGQLLKQHRQLTGRRPRLLHLPRAFEAAVQIDHGRVEGCHEKQVGKLRERDAVAIFGCPVVWDAREFRVE